MPCQGSFSYQRPSAWNAVPDYLARSPAVAEKEPIVHILIYSIKRESAVDACSFWCSNIWRKNVKNV